jgi:hypothetical protein
MKRLQTLFVAVLLSSFGTLAFASDRSETLRAINMVENPTNQTAYGSMGELGPYQFRSSTWRMHSSKPFRMANDRASADQVAVIHYEWIKNRLKEAGIDANNYNIAMAWNCGLGAVIKGRVPMQTYHYAERVNNLADSFHGASVAQPEQVAVAAQTSLPAAAGQFALGDSCSAPEFKIISNPFVVRLSGEPSRFVIDPPKPRFVLVSN